MSSVEHHDNDSAITPRVVWLFCVVATLLALSLAMGPLEGIPHVTDEISYTLQSKLFAAGHRFGPPPDNSSMWMLPFWSTGGPAYSPFPWGWPLLLAMGELVGAAVWVNPLMVGLVPWLLFRIGCRVGDPNLGLRSAMIAAFSPGLLLLGASRMAHTSVLVALGALMVLVLDRHWTRRRMFFGGLAAAYVVIARPYDAALLVTPLMILGIRETGLKTAYLWLGVPCLAAAIVLWDNWTLTGDIARFPMSAWFDAWQGRQGCNALGFGPEIGCAPTLGGFGHTPSKALTLAQEAWLRYDRLLLGVPGGTLIALIGAWRLGARRGVAWVVLVAVGYAIYWSPGRAYGARFWHPMYLVVPVGVAAVVRAVPMRWVGAGVVIGSVLGFRTAVPELSNGYWCVDASLRDQLAEQGIDEGVVFLKSHGRRSVQWPALGVERFQCDPMLEAGDAWAVADPARMTGGLQFRHALSDDADTAEFMRRHHPGQPAFRVVHDVEENVRTIRRLGVFNAR